MDGQRVCQVRTNFRQTFLFQAETFVRFVKGHTELMRSGGKRVLELNRLPGASDSKFAVKSNSLSAKMANVPSLTAEIISM